MSAWGSAKARKVLKALLKIGWSIKRETGGSHRVLQRSGWSDYVFAFHAGTEIGPRMLARIAKHTGLKFHEDRPVNDLRNPGPTPIGHA
jgi:predicted RNA binding protein YcfA (HicA-like mRNA interferase family)